MTVDDLAQIIRHVDGKNDLGAGALAEAILREAALPSPRELAALLDLLVAVRQFVRAEALHDSTFDEEFEGTDDDADELLEQWGDARQRVDVALLALEALQPPEGSDR